MVTSEIGEVSFDKPEPINNLITWVYENGSFVPTAKLTDSESFSIVSDYIGRPVLAFDEKGEKVWSCDYDIYGNLRNLKGDRTFIPFRQLGQYEDEETGLYYNRFRYYSPETGAYISQDPISILGGLNVYAYVKDTNRFVDIFGLNELLYRMRLQVQTGSKNIVSRAIQSKEPITAELFSEEMKNMINDLKKVRKDLVDKTEKAALKISKKVQALANTGNGISSTGNILREKFEGKKGEFIRLDVENLEGVNLIKCT